MMAVRTLLINQIMKIPIDPTANSRNNSKKEIKFMSIKHNLIMHPMHPTDQIEQMKIWLIVLELIYQQ